MKKDLTRYAMTILLACSLLLSGCGSIPIPGTGFGDNLPTDSRQSGEETEPEQEGQNEDLSRNGSMNKEQENTEEKADAGSTDQTGAVTSEKFRNTEKERQHVRCAVVFNSNIYPRLQDQPPSYS